MGTELISILSSTRDTRQHQKRDKQQKIEDMLMHVLDFISAVYFSCSGVAGRQHDKARRIARLDPHKHIILLCGARLGQCLLHVGWRGN